MSLPTRLQAATVASSTPTTGDDHPQQPSVSTSETEEEERPNHTSEIGILRKLNEGGTAWLGSSSGVHFVNTVRRAFATAFVESKNGDPALPASEDILTGEDSEGRSYNGPVSDLPSTTDHDFRHMLSSALGVPPTDRRIAMDLITTFFRSWHPLFPFLHGPTFLQDVEKIYPSQPDTSEEKGGSSHSRATANMANQSIDIRKKIVFQLIINIASLDRSDIQLPVESRIKSTADVTRIAGYISLNHDIETIQALIAASLYLIATIALRQASTVAGMFVKLIYHAGLHRCPWRYADVSAEQYEIRKRIFWSAYAVDRHCSLSLGLPNSLQDSDIDVCLSGKELHRPKLPNPAATSSSNRPQRQSHAHHNSSSWTNDNRNPTEGPYTPEKHPREAALAAYVQYSRLTGRIIELFHKSIHARFPKKEAILYLNSDIENWWNDLPGVFTEEELPKVLPEDESNARQHQHLAPFFTILYQQLLLLLNRPRLSLDQSTAEFQHGLSVCIKASRHTLAALQKQKDRGQSMSLPGLLSAAWMSGLIIGFACHLGKYSKARACTDIVKCQDILQSMNIRWFTVQNCHKALSLLLANIQSTKDPANGGTPDSMRPMERSSEASGENKSNPRKRTRTPVTDEPRISSPFSRTDSKFDALLPGSENAHLPPHFIPEATAPRTADQNYPNLIFPEQPFPQSAAGTELPFSMPPTPNLDFLPFNSLIPDNAGSASYITLQDMASASVQNQRNYNLPESYDLRASPSMFWANMSDMYNGHPWTDIGPGIGDLPFSGADSGSGNSA